MFANLMKGNAFGLLNVPIPIHICYLHAKFLIMYKNLFLASFVLIFAASCSKDDNESGPSKSELLTSSAWKYDTAGIDANSDGSIDTPLPDGSVEDCDKDNTFTFQSGGTGIADAGATKCDSAEAQTVNFNYTLNSNGTVINFPDTVITGISGDVSVLTLTSSKLVLSKAIEIGLPIPVNVIVQLKH